jgi:hypothetical protein
MNCTLNLQKTKLTELEEQLGAQIELNKMQQQRIERKEE